MQLPRKKVSIILISVFVVTAISVGVTVGVTVVDANKVSITFIDSGSASIMIEANGKRAYIDLVLTFTIEDQYDDLKADAIFITHPHGDHFNPYSIDVVTKETTEFIGPSSCEDYNNLYNATGVVPGDTGEIAGFQFQAFYAYNLGHPVENQWCSYIITVNGISIFISGDTANLTEYEQLTGIIDVAVLPVGYSCSNMGPDGAVSAVGVIEPSYVIPAHYGTADISYFITSCQNANPGTAIHNSHNPLIVNIY